MQRKSLFPEPKSELHPEPLRQFNNPERPFWGVGSFEQFSHIPRKDYDQAVKDVTMELADGDESVGRITSDFSKAFKVKGGKRGLGKKGMLELMFRIGVMLNEVEGAKR